MHICFLDIDGTLILTGGAGQTAFAQTLDEEFGVREIVHRVTFAGRSDRAIAMDLLRLHGVETSDANWARFRAGYLNRLDAALATRRGAVLPGVSGLLEALADRGDVAIGLLTGNLQEGARRKLRYYNLWHWFPFGGFGDEHLERNGIAASALVAARAYVDGKSANNGDGSGGVAIENVVVIGDTENDIVCGRSIGARTVAVPTGSTPIATLRSCEPHVLVETLEDLRPILELFDSPLHNTL